MFGCFDFLGIYDLQIILLSPQKKKKLMRSQYKMRIRRKYNIVSNPAFYPKRSNRNS